MENNVKDTNSTEFVEEAQVVDNAATAEQNYNNQRSIDPALIEELKLSQSLSGAVLGGLLGAVGGAIAWAIVTAITNYQIGYMALGVGFLTGFMVKKLGHGFEKRFAYIGALCSFIGCFAGNLLAVLIVVSNQESIPFIELLRLLNVEIIVSLIKDTFSPMDILFYGIAVYEGYRFSLMTRVEVTEKLNNMAAKTYSI